MKLPFADDNRQWIKEALGSRIRPTWEKAPASHWTIAREHLTVLVDALVDRYGEVEVVMDYRTTEQCDTRCQIATGVDCTCSCLGENHGGAGSVRGWRHVGETTLVSSGEAHQVRRLVTKS